MKKKTLVSILALASAPMAGYANANLDQIKTDAATDWTGASDLKVEGGVISSPSGTAITQNIGKLLPGNYRLEYNTDPNISKNVSLSLSGAVLGENNEFKLTTETEVTVILRGAGDGAFQIGGLQLVLVYNFNAANIGLTTELSKITDRINDQAANVEDLRLEASQLFAKIATIKDGAENAYTVYSEMGLYKGFDAATTPWMSSTIMSEISEFGDKVIGQADNDDPYFVSMDLAKLYEGDLNGKKFTQNVGDDDPAAVAEYTYVTNITSTEWNAAVNRITTFKNEADAWHAEGTAAEHLTTTYNATFEKEIKDLIAKYVAARDEAVNDHAAYVEVADTISDLKADYNAMLQDIYDRMQGDAREVARQNAQREMNEVYVDILEVEQINGDVNNHTQAFQEKDNNKGKLSGYRGNMTQLMKYYVNDLAVELDNAYTNALKKHVYLQDRLTGEEGGVANFEGVAEKFAKEIEDVQVLLDDLKEKIEAANAGYNSETKEYTILVTDFSDDAADVKAINDAINNIIKSAVGTTTNYYAYVEMSDSISAVQDSLDHSKLYVDTLKAEGGETLGEYLVNGRFDGTENTIQDKLTGYRNALQTSLAEGTSVKWKDDNKANVESLKDEIGTYLKNADASKKAYDEVSVALDDYYEAINALKKVVGTETYVTVLGGTDTYGQRIADFENKCNQIIAKINEAFTKYDAEHLKRLQEAEGMLASVGANIVADANTLQEDFEDAKAEYEKNVVNNTIKTLLNQAQNYADSYTDRLVSDWEEKYRGKLGINEEGIEIERKELENAVNEWSIKIPDLNNIESIPDDEKAEALALLSEINQGLGLLSTEITALEGKADAAKEHVAANTAKYNDVTKQLNETLKNINSIKGKNEDPSRTSEFDGYISDLESKRTELLGDIDNSKTNETLVADMDGDGTEENPGYTKQIEALNSLVKEYIALAATSTENWKAYQGLTVVWGDLSKTDGTIIQGHINTASDDLGKMAVTAGTTHFRESLTQLGMDYAVLQKEIYTAYNETRTCHEVSDFSERLHNLNESVTSIVAAAKANEACYAVHINGSEEIDYGYNAVEALWSKVYYDISTGDQTSQVQSYLNRLTVVQNEMLEFKKKIEEYYANGLSSDKDTEVLESLKAFRQDIWDIQSDQNTGLPSAIAADNKERKLRLDSVITATRTEYTNALGIITKFSQLQNAAFIELVSSAVTTANDAINGFLTELRSEESKADEEYEATINSATADKVEIFDADEKHLAAVEQIKQKIIDAVNTMNETVVGDDTKGAKKYFNDQISTYQGIYNYVEKDLKEDAKFNDVHAIQPALKEAFDILAAANKAKEAEFMPLLVDEHLTEMEKLPELLTDAQQDAALYQWNYQEKRATDSIAEQRANLLVWDYADDADNSKHDKYIEDYDALITAYYDEAKKLYNSVQNQKLYPTGSTTEDKPVYDPTVTEIESSNIGKLDALMDDFITKAWTLYLGAWEARNSMADSKAAYADLIQLVEKVENAWDVANDYVADFSITGVGSYATLNQIETNLGYIRYTAANERDAGTCVSYRDTNKPTLKSYLNVTLGNPFFVSANDEEKKKIGTEFSVLRGEQNKAADAVDTDAALAAEVNAFIDTINQLEDEFDKAHEKDGAIWKLQNDGKYKDIKPLYLEYEEKIADLRAKLVAYYDTDNTQTTKALSDLNGQSEAVRTELGSATAALAGMHQPVIEMFTDSLASVGTALDVVDDEIVAQNEAGRILFYQEKLAFKLTALSEDVKYFINAMNTAEAPYKENDEVLAGLQVDMQEIKDSLTAVSGIWDSYKYLNKEIVTKAIAAINEDIAKDEKWLTDYSVSGTYFKYGMILPNGASILVEITNKHEEYTHTELCRCIGYKDEWGDVAVSYDENELPYKYWEVKNFFNKSGHRYLNSDKSVIQNSLNAIRDSILYLVDFNDKVYRNKKVNRDVNGILHPDYDGNKQPDCWRYDYLEVIQSIRDRISVLDNQLTELNALIEEKYYILGDVDEDDIVTINDYMDVVSYAVKAQDWPENPVIFAAADVNNDAQINIGDVTGVANIIQGRNWNGTSTFTLNTLRQRGAVDRTIATTDGIEMSMTEENGLHRIAIRLNNTVNYAGLQLDVNLPAGVTVMSETLGTRAEGHELFSNAMADGTYRILISSLESSEFNNTDDAVIYLEVSGDAASKITVSNVLASDARGVVYSIGGQGGDGTTGINGVQATQNLKQRIYSVGGQVMQKLTRGLNIIQNSDGTTKKVLKK